MQKTGETGATRETRRRPVYMEKTPLEPHTSRNARMVTFMNRWRLRTTMSEKPLGGVCRLRGIPTWHGFFFQEFQQVPTLKNLEKSLQSSDRSRKGIKTLLIGPKASRKLNGNAAAREGSRGEGKSIH